MPQTIQLKNTTIAADSLSTLLKGEPAVNFADKQLIVGDGTNNITLLDADVFSPDGTIMTEVLKIGSERHPIYGLQRMPKVILNGVSTVFTPDSNYGVFSISMGYNSRALSGSSIVVGTNNTVEGDSVFTDGSVCIGDQCKVNNGSNNYLFGCTNTAETLSGQVILFGSQNTCYADCGIMFGYYNTLNNPVGGAVLGTIILGQGITTDLDGYVLLGSYDATLALTPDFRVGIGCSATLTAITQRLQVNGGVRLETDDTRPAADADSRGTIWVAKGGSGVADTLQVCLKASGGTYSWKTIATG